MWREAEWQLAGAGDPLLGEWRETGVKAVHLRRRLSGREQQAVGPVIDIRGSDEARARAARLGPRLALVPPQVLAEECGSPRP